MSLLRGLPHFLRQPRANSNSRPLALGNLLGQSPLEFGLLHLEDCHIG